MEKLDIVLRRKQQRGGPNKKKIGRLKRTSRGRAACCSARKQFQTQLHVDENCTRSGQRGKLETRCVKGRMQRTAKDDLTGQVALLSDDDTGL